MSTTCHAGSTGSPPRMTGVSRIHCRRCGASHSKVEPSQKRVASRGRPEEGGLSADFHRELHERHLAYLAALDHPHGCIDAAGPASSVAGAVVGVAEALRRGEPPPPGGLAVARARGGGPD